MVTVSRNTIRANSWKNTFDAIKAGTTSEVSNRVYAAFPLDTITLPLIIIENTAITGHEKVLTGEADSKITHLVTIYTKKASEIDSIADKVDATLRATSGTFATSGQYLIDITDNGTVEFENINDQRNFSKTLTVQFQV